MVTFKDVQLYLNQLIQDGKILKWEIIEDRGDKVVIHVIHLLDEERYEGRNYVLLIKNRGQANEQVFWAREKPAPVLPKTSTFENIISDIKHQIIKDLKVKYNVITIDSYQINENGKYVSVSAIVDNKDGTVSRQEFIIVINVVDKSYSIYKVV